MPVRMTDVATRTYRVVPLGSQTWMRLQIRLERPPRDAGIPRCRRRRGTSPCRGSWTWLPNVVFLPLTSHCRPMRPLLGAGVRPDRVETFCLAVGLCGLRPPWTLPHYSTRSQTLWGGTASLHCGQMLSAGAVRASWLLRIPFADFDLRLFGMPGHDTVAPHVCSLDAVRKGDDYPHRPGAWQGQSGGEAGRKGAGNAGGKVRNAECGKRERMVTDRLRRPCFPHSALCFSASTRPAWSVRPRRRSRASGCGAVRAARAGRRAW